MSWVTDNWIPLTVVGGLVGVSWYAGKHFDESESYNADEKRINGMTLDEWLDEIDRIKSTKKPHFYTNEFLGSPKYDNGIDSFWEQGWSPQGILHVWKWYDNDARYFEKNKAWKKMSAESFNADEGIWNNASKEKRLKWLKDAIPSIGDKYADYTWRELTPRLQEEMTDESYDAETFEAEYFEKGYGEGSFPKLMKKGDYGVLESIWDNDWRDDYSEGNLFEITCVWNDDYSKATIQSSLKPLPKDNLCATLYFQQFGDGFHTWGTFNEAFHDIPEIKKMWADLMGKDVKDYDYNDYDWNTDRELHQYEFDFVNDFEEKYEKFSRAFYKMDASFKGAMAKVGFQGAYMGFPFMQSIHYFDWDFDSFEPAKCTDHEWSNAYVRDTEYDEDGSGSVAFGQDCTICGVQRRGSAYSEVSWDMKAETFNADDWEYTDEWYDSALPKIAKRVNEELIADSEMNDEMYSLYEDELFDGNSQTLIPYVDNALKIEYPKLTKYQRDEIISEGGMVGELSYSYDFNAETFAAYVSKADTQRVRQLLKQEFPNLKFSVVKDGGRMSVSIMAGDIDFSDINDDVPRTKRYWERWGNPKPVFDGKLDINQYHLDGYNPKYTPLFEKIVSIMKGEDWFDHSDSQTDYFHTAYYIDLNIGKWNKPYEYKPNLKRGTRPTLESLVYKQGYGDDALTGLKGAYDEETFEAPLARGRGRVGYQYEFCLNKDHSKAVRQALKKEHPQLKIRVKIDDCNTMLAWLISGNQDLNDENFESLKEAIEQTMMDALENMDDTDGENINVFCYLGDWTKNQDYTQNAETFEASAVARNKAKTPVEKVLLHEELMNQAARNEMITKLTYDLAMRRGVHRQPMRTIKEAEYDSKLKKEFGDD